MRWGRTAIAGFAFAATAEAQSFDPQNQPALPGFVEIERRCFDEQAKSRLEALDGVMPFGGAYRQPGLFVLVPDGNCRIVSFYRLAAKLPSTGSPREFRRRQAEFAGKTAAPIFVARYIGDDTDNFFAPLWADQTRCRALVPAIEKLEKITAPKFVGDGPYRGVPSTITDASTFELWLQGVVYPQENSAYVMSSTMTSSGKKTALSNWFEDTLTALKPCWSSQEPKF
jgi:hypothetical protein